MAARSESKKWTGGVTKAGPGTSSTTDKALEQLARAIDLLAKQQRD